MTGVGDYLMKKQLFIISIRKTFSDNDFIFSWNILW